MRSLLIKPTSLKGASVVSAVRQWWHILAGLYLQACGERSRWFPVRGEHHLFPGISFDFGRIHFTSAENGCRESAALVDDFGELNLLTKNGEVLRLVSSGKNSATLIYPDGKHAENLRCNRYSTEIVRHGVFSYVSRISLGEAILTCLGCGAVGVDGEYFSSSGDKSWTKLLPDGSTLKYRPHCHLVSSGRGPVRVFVYAACEGRLLEVDYCRREFSFIYVTNSSESPTQILDSIVTVYPEDGSVQILHHSSYTRGEEIDFYGPTGGLRITREEGSDVLYAYQGQQLIGIAEFCPNAGYDFKSDKAFNRWAFSSGKQTKTPQGEGWHSPATTAVVAAIPLTVVASLLLGDAVAFAIGVPVFGSLVCVVAVKKFKRALQCLSL